VKPTVVSIIGVLAIVTSRNHVSHIVQWGRCFFLPVQIACGSQQDADDSPDGACVGVCLYRMLRGV
jgi:hypothetical protein